MSICIFLFLSVCLSVSTRACIQVKSCVDKEVDYRNIHNSSKSICISITLILHLRSSTRFKRLSASLWQRQNWARRTMLGRTSDPRSRCCIERSTTMTGLHEDSTAVSLTKHQMGCPCWSVSIDFNSLAGLNFSREFIGYFLNLSNSSNVNKL